MLTLTEEARRPGSVAGLRLEPWCPGVSHRSVDSFRGGFLGLAFVAESHCVRRFPGQSFPLLFAKGDL